MNRSVVVMCVLSVAAACGPFDANSPSRPPLAQKWLDRAELGYKTGDFDDAKLSIDEALLAIRNAVARIGAKRAVIDSLSGLELALAPTFREDFRESLYRMVGALTSVGVTVLSTVELSDSFTDLRFSPHGIAFLTDAIIMQRYIELDGVLTRAMTVVKVRGSDHSKQLREYEITGRGGIRGGGGLKGYEGLLSGTAVRTRSTIDDT